LYVATATKVDCPLRGTIRASAYVPVDVGLGRLVDPPRTVAIGAHHPANASVQVTT
jgi:hypothetical protein